MEDFTRELKAGAALFLLYGESAVGKTRLLQELSQSRLADSRIHWLDLSEGSDLENTLQDNSRVVETVFASAQQGDIIIADHFEMTLRKTRHQLFLSWSADGVDKQITLIIASNTEGFNELRQLSQQYQVPVRSFQQMPFDADEVNAFVGFYLFPDQPIGNLSIPATLRRQLAVTGGAVGRVIDVIERDGAQISSSAKTDSASIRQGVRVIATVFILFVLAMGVGWYYLGDKFEVAELVPELAATESAPTTIVEPVVEAEIAVQPEVEPVSEVVAEIEAGVADEQVTEAEIEAEPETKQGAETETVLEVGQEAETETVLEVGLEAETEIVLEAGQEAPTETMLEADNTDKAAAQDVVTAQASTVADTEVVIVAQESSAQQQTTQSSETAISVDPAQLEPSGKTRFQRELDMSYNWVTSKERSVGTMQIMMLSFKTFDEAVYYKYVESLASKRVDTSQLRVFKTSTGGAEFYSVFYGEYASWQAAKKAKNSLPEVLRKTSPIARSVGGILKEIRRLEAES